MQTLTHGRAAAIERRDPLPLVEFVHSRDEPAVRTRERVLPEPPPQPDIPPRPQVELAHETRPVIPRPQFSLSLDRAPVLAGGIYAGVPASGAADRDILPVSRIPPRYPYQATRRKIEGWVRVSFLVTDSGTVEDAVVLESEPEGMFERAALDAVRKWTFKPRIVDGRPVPARAEQVVEFKLNE
jgi:protein TonB